MLGAHVPRVPPSVELDVAPHPFRVRALGSQAVMAKPDALAKALEEPGRGRAAG